MEIDNRKLSKKVAGILKKLVRIGKNRTTFIRYKKSILEHDKCACLFEVTRVLSSFDLHVFRSVVCPYEDLVKKVLMNLEVRNLQSKIGLHLFGAL